MKLQLLPPRSGTQPATALHAKLITKQLQAKRTGANIPDAVIHEILSYASRNAQAFSPRAVHTCCPACIKAHTYVQASKHTLPDTLQKELLTLFPGIVGHDGYYLDEDSLVRMNDF